MKNIKIKDKNFTVSIKSSEIQNTISKIADKMNIKFKDKDVVFVCILNGAFMFASDLIKQITFKCRITFVKLASYSGTTSTEKIKKLIGIDYDMADKTVVVIEDIIDSGLTIENIIKELSLLKPKEIHVATLFFKPQALKKKVKPDFIGKEISNDFIVGFGLDYDGYGRNYKQIYTLTQ